MTEQKLEFVKVDSNIDEKKRYEAQKREEYIEGTITEDKNGSWDIIIEDRLENNIFFEDSGYNSLRGLKNNIDPEIKGRKYDIEIYETNHNIEYKDDEIAVVKSRLRDAEYTTTIHRINGDIYRRIIRYEDSGELEIQEETDNYFITLKEQIKDSKKIAEESLTDLFLN